MTAPPAVPVGRPAPAADPELIDVPGVLAMIPVARGTLYEWVACGRFPRPLPLSARRHFWLRADVLAFLDRLAAEAREASQDRPGLSS